MSGINKVILVGRLGRDPELKDVNQTQVAQLSLATSDNWTDKNGQKQERTEWHRVVVWGKAAGVLAQYAKKGRQLYIEGKVRTRSWDDNGQTRYATEIVAENFQFLGDNPSAQRGDNFGPESGGFSDSNDIPF